MVQTKRHINPRITNRIYDLIEQGKYDTALLQARKHIGHNTDLYSFFKGLAAKYQGDISNAVKSWEQALLINPANEGALNHLTDTYIELGMIEEAEVCARSALLLSESLQNRKLLVQVLFAKKDKEKLEEILDLLTTMVQEDPSATYAQLAAVLLALHKFELAEKFAMFALLEDPTDPLTLRNLASIYLNQQKPQEAIDALNSIEGTPDQKIDAQYQKGMIQLMMGNNEGWKNIEQRTLLSTYQRKGIVSRFPRLSEFNKKHFGHVLVFAEQGIGDTLQFSRYLPEFREFCLLKNPNCRIDFALNKNIFNERAPLKDFMQLNMREHVDSFIEIDDIRDDYSSCISLMSLPYLLQTLPDQTKFITDISYDAMLGKKNIGLFWRGSELNINNEQRSISDYQISKLLDYDANWVPLQLHHFPSTKFTKMPVDSLTELAATIETLDLVITVDSMPAHLAAGLGKPVWLMLHKIPDWRWEFTGESTKWYPNMQLFRQSRWGDWDSVITQIQASLNSIK